MRFRRAGSGVSECVVFFFWELGGGGGERGRERIDCMYLALQECGESEVASYDWKQ